MKYLMTAVIVFIHDIALSHFLEDFACHVRLRYLNTVD